VVLIIAALAGFIWAAIAGVLKTKFGVHEVISTIMLNYIAMCFEGYVLNSPLKAVGAIPQTPPVHESCRLMQLIPSSHTPLNSGFIIAVVAAFIIWYVLKKTIYGYEVKAVGLTPSACENVGINVNKHIIFIIGISGLLAGLGGGVRVVGGSCQYSYLQGIMADYGFDGIAVALLAHNNPIGVIVAAILFSALRVGGRMMQFQTDIPSQIVMMIQAIIILLIAGENIFRYIIFRKKKRNLMKKSEHTLEKSVEIKTEVEND
jgi:general nucleoside transport system permease protein